MSQLNSSLQNPNMLSKHKPFMLSKKFTETAVLPELNWIMFNLLKYMNNLSLLNPLVFDYMIDLCRIN